MFVLPLGGGAKREGIISTGTSKRAGRIIVRITIRPRTSRLEHLRVNRRLTQGRRVIRAATAVLRAPKRLASALAPAAVAHPQLRRALQIQVGHAPGRRAHTRPATRLHYHGHVVAVHEAHVVEILPAGAEGELGQGRRRRGSGAFAFDLTGTAVAGGAGGGG